jgi:polysaccharide export outer membrane protein
MLATVILGLLALVIVGCAPPKYTDYDAFLKRPRPIVGGKPYVIEPPDTLRLLVPQVPELDSDTDRDKRVRPDGYVTFPLIGEVFAAGKTPTQLASEIEEKILKYYEDVSVQVEVNPLSKVYYMAGETAAGPKPYRGNETVLDAILASGVPRTAWPEHIVVIRPNEEGELIRRMSINLKDMTERGDLRYNAVIEEGDIIFIPTNPIAAVGIFIQNLLSPIDPAVDMLSTPARVGAAVP